MKVFIVLVLLSFKSFACLNGESKYLKNGEIAYIDFRGLVPHGHNFSNFKSSKILIELDSLYRKTNDIEYLSDKGYVLIIQKKYHEALQLYLNIEKIKPNRYSTASNIGTLYELIGENQKAYNWIKKSIEINPESHYGSEWLHLKILEAKVKDIKNVSGEFLTNNSFGKEAFPKTNLSNKQLRLFAQSVYFQVNERMSFIKPEDHIISVLLFELGNAVKIIGENQNAKQIYKKAKEYGFKDKIIDKRLNSYYESSASYGKIKNQKKSESINNKVRIDIWIVISIIGGVILIGLILFYSKSKNSKNTQS
ncbi:tetratricopeptide repeat protein [Flavobacterium chungangense]|uniref:tetratricopeptide repeat protein n=1 Tax=Flavobacterium chungangense TaxID=554283 RepID=UPI001428B069|nr:tetratricopeptide repeat protein [Flavobacterium chungangense]